MKNWTDYKVALIKALNSFEFDYEILDLLKNSIQNNQKIFVAGNGGRASIATHFVCVFSLIFQLTVTSLQKTYTVFSDIFFPFI